MDNKVAYIGGFLLSTITSINVLGILNAALVGLVGGFFGLLGKEVYYYVKSRINKKL